ncbi:MAG: alpha/beta hydrolase [Alphaproteobacteria bacterium]
MNAFDSDGIRIAFRDEGEGAPVLLIHGFASNHAVNWANTGWIDTLKRNGYRVIAIDNRGHGQSGKLYDAASYSAQEMAEDARRLLDHLNIRRAHVMGYSMGARIAAFLAISHPERVASAVFAGLGINMVRGLGDEERIAAALEAQSVNDVADSSSRGFRVFAEQTGSDLRALAACIRGSRERISAEALADIRCPVLVAVGTTDNIAGSGPELATLIPGAEALEITNRDHMKAVGDPIYKKGVLEFLARQVEDAHRQ